LEGRAPGRTRLLWTTCAAVVAHAAAYAVVPRIQVGTRHAPPAPHAEQELDVNVDDEAPAQTSPSPTPTEVALPQRIAEAARGGPGNLHRSAAEQIPVSPQSEPIEPSTDGRWTFSPSTAGSGHANRPLAGHGLEAAVHAGIAATLEQDRQADAHRQRVIPVFTPGEIELGLVPGGVLASLGRDIARRSRVPDVSRAQLQFDTDAAGLVVAFRVLEASSARFEWEEVARDIATASHEKPALRVPSGWTGLAITVAISCDLRTVDGATSRDLFDRAAHLSLLRIAKARVVDVSVF
jgi:hypothetical protein